MCIKVFMTTARHLEGQQHETHRGHKALVQGSGFRVQG